MKKYSLLRRLNYLLWNKHINQHAFSLIELTIVVAIIAILSLLVSVNISFFDSTLIKSEIQKLHSVCHYLRRKALATNQIQTLLFDLKNNTYTYNDTTEHYAQLMHIHCAPGIKGPPSAPQHMVTNPITFKNNTIVFYPSGIISAGTLYVSDKNNNYQYALSAPIAPVSYIRMYTYDKKWKLLS